jgi:hypothetical protein
MCLGCGKQPALDLFRKEDRYRQEFYSFCCVLTLLFQASILGCQSCRSFMRQFLIRTPKEM